MTCEPAGVTLGASSDLDLFPPTFPRTGPRFDDTDACPIDAPRHLDAVVRAAGLRLRALVDTRHGDDRTIGQRARLQQVLRDAAQARARLADGTYGACLACASRISLARLTECPWARRCIHCDLDI
jgi:hypothetical protein